MNDIFKRRVSDIWKFQRFAIWVLKISLSFPTFEAIAGSQPFWIEV